MAVFPSAAISKEKSPVKIQSAKAFKGMQDVTIGTFEVAFVTEKTDQAFAGKRGTFGGSTYAKTRLDGVDAATMQAITDAAYEDFAAKMTAAGYRISDRGQFTASAYGAKVKYVASGAPGMLTYGKDSKARAMYFAPTAFGPLALVPPVNSTGIMGAIGAAGGGGGSAQAYAMYAYSTKQPVISVRYAVDFADSKHYGGAFALGSSIKLAAQLAVVPVHTTITLVSGDGKYGSIILDTPVAVEGDFGSLEDVTSTGQKVENVVGNVIGILGGVGTANYKRFAFKAEAEQYLIGSIEAAKRSSDVMVTALLGLR